MMKTINKLHQLPLRVAVIAIMTMLYACTPDTENNTQTATEVGLAGSELADQDIKTQLQGTAGGGETHPGASLYTTRCATCHESGVTKAPARNIMELLSPESLLATMQTGIMRQQAAGLSNQQQEHIVEYLVGTLHSDQPTLHMCEKGQSEFDLQQQPVATGWGIDRNNSRKTKTGTTNIDATTLPKLEVKWVFDYPLSTRARSHPSFAGGAVHVGSQSGAVYALDQETGCIRWIYMAGAEVRTGISIPEWDTDERPIGYFADVLAYSHAIDLRDGSLVWKRKVDDHPNATLTAQPLVFESRVYQPVSSLEVVPAANPDYPCCSFRGSVAVMDATNGELIKKIFTIPQAPAQVGENNVGTPILAPSGAPVWNSPTLDEELRRIYVGTGENYSSPAEGHSDAIIAMDIDKLEIAWVRQTTERDAWNVACMVFIENKTNCPVEEGPDYDYGAPPILIEDGDQRILVAGQKSGEIFGIDPLSGSLLWSNKVGRGGNQGGMHFGMAADGNTVYVPISDYTDASLSEEDARPGMYALNAFDGSLLWSRPAINNCGGKVDCDPGISAAVTAVDGAVLAGHMDGMLRAYAKQDGATLWEFDTDQEFTSIAGRVAKGGSFGGGTAPMAYRNKLYANSGYGLYFHRPGNVLIAWGPKD